MTSTREDSEDPPSSKHRRVVEGAVYLAENETGAGRPEAVEPALPSSTDPSAALVSIIIPCYNGAPWLQECLESVIGQTYSPLELSFWDDASVDSSTKLLDAARPALEARGIHVVSGCSVGEKPLGCGAAKNRAVRQSSGRYLCFLDADDTMLPDRVAQQLELAMRKGPDCLLGCNVLREPADAQPRYSSWLNALTDEQLVVQRFKECTLAMPTWFCARELFDKVGAFDEAGPGTPEDLDFFYRHLRQGGMLAKVSVPLVKYRYHESQASRGVSADKIWALRLAQLEGDLIDGLASFSIWSAGRDGKRLYRGLTATNRKKVYAFLDIDAKKMTGGGYFDRELKRHVPIVDWKTAADPAYHPTIICVKSGLHEGFEENLASLLLQEGRQYWHFN